FVAAGPLAWIHAALGATHHAHAFVVACDMPFLRIEPIALLLRYVGDADAVIPWWEGDIEPLHAVYKTSLRPRIARALEQGVTAIRDLLPLLRVSYVPESLMRSCAGAEEAFRNVNTPEDAFRFSIQVNPEGDLIDGVRPAK
ncbi:MAG: molybdenum cofactor guanylyltransferase, partial [Deltaproteobacteria bacterium]|nr:molybdenum cofactor guanylyltransferase [Deltaproteobacteria bacterium]